MRREDDEKIVERLRLQKLIVLILEYWFQKIRKNHMISAWRFDVTFRELRKSEFWRFLFSVSPGDWETEYITCKIYYKFLSRCYLFLLMVIYYFSQTWLSKLVLCEVHRTNTSEANSHYTEKCSFMFRHLLSGVTTSLLGVIRCSFSMFTMKYSCIFLFCFFWI